MLSKLQRIILFLLIFKIDAATAKIKLPALITKGMVLQRDKPLKLWGWAAPGELVNIQFNGKSYQTQTGEDSNWKITLPAMKAGGPYQMVIKGTNEIILDDILLGDVWICSGQSNMEFTMGRAKDTYPQEIQASANNQIRQFFVRQEANFNVQNDFQPGYWAAADPKSVLSFTAAGYFFALNIYNKYRIPVGIINSSVGGTPAEAWMSEEGLNAFPKYQQEANFFKDPAKVAAIKSKDDAARKQWFDHVRQQDKGYADKGAYWFAGSLDPSSWTDINVPGFWQDQGLKDVSGVVWYRRDFNNDIVGKPAELYLGNIEERDTTYINGIRVGYTSSKHNTRKYLIPAGVLKAGENTITIRVLDTESPGGFIQGKAYQLVVEGKTIPLAGQWKYKVGAATVPLRSADLTNFSYKPTVWYNTKIAPLIDYQIKGVLWYQGEANVSKAKEYQTLFPALIRDWRNKFGQGDFPFLFVQLASMGPAEKEPSDHALARLREAQTMALAIPNTGMAAAHDIGEWNDIHPQNKKDVGLRLYRAALKVAYKEPGATATGPLLESVKVKGNTMLVRFTNVGAGLTTSDQKEVGFFAVSGADKKFEWAKAVILSKNTVQVSSDKVSAPVYVRYAWARNPEGANLSNKEGLPAVAFRTDTDN